MGMPYKIVAQGNRPRSFSKLTVVSSEQESHTFLIENVSKPSFRFVCVNHNLLTKFCQLQWGKGQHNGHSDMSDTASDFLGSQQAYYVIPLTY